MLKNAKSKPFFLILFPIFFVLHGFTENYDSVSVGEALLLALEYIAFTLLLTTCFWLLNQDLLKASLMALVVISFYFFFGNMLDLIKNYVAVPFISRYRTIIPAGLVVLVTLFVLLKRTNKSFQRLTAYLNILMVILILLDAGWLISKLPRTAKAKRFDPAAEGFVMCHTCKSPDIFFIVPDQYTGNTALIGSFHFDNTSFENELKRRGFYIPAKSRSNYNLTPFSIASTLNMDYLSLKPGPQNYQTVSYSYGVIRNSRVLKFLAASGYDFYNYSIFDFKNHAAHKYIAFLPYGKKLITSQTFFNRVANDFESDILAGKLGPSLQKKYAYDNLYFNDTILNLTSKIAATRTASPKFVYSHLIMPHYPYYFDRNGRPVPLQKLTGAHDKVDLNDYIGYLQYTNKRILQLVDQILSTSAAPPIIIVLGDHGLQYRQNNYDPRNDFVNLNAVYFPNGDYSQFYDSITNVNEFRVVFNSYFNQRLPLVRDSTINVWDNSAISRF